MDHINLIMYLLVGLCCGAIGYLSYWWIHRNNKQDNVEIEDVSQEPKENPQLEDSIVQSDDLIKQYKLQIEELSEKLEDSEGLNKHNKLQIEELSERLEDSEDDVLRYKQISESQVHENGELIDKLSTAKRSINELNSSLELTKSVLDDTREELQSGNDSLSFIREILTAKPVSNESVDKEEQKINAIFTFVITHIKDIYKRYINETPPPELFDKGIKEWVVVKRKTWIEGKKTIAFIGEFNAGKTSIVNRILSQDNPDIIPLPVKSEATTAIPTYIAGGPITSYYFYSPDGILKSINEAVFKKVSKSILEKVDGVSELIKYFVMTYDNPNLEGLSLLDTPGFGSGEREDAFRTIDVINECDVLFWVVDVTTGIVNASSLKVIKENMTRPLYVIINKTDLRAKIEVDDAEDKIRETFDENGIDVKGYIRFYDGKSVDEIMNTISSVHRNSFAESYLTTLRDALDSVVEKCKTDRIEADRIYSEIIGICDSKYDSITKSCNRITQESEKARDIPRWTTYLIRHDRYEMERNEGEKLKELLGDIARTVAPEIKNAADDYGQLMQDREKASQELVEKENVEQLFVNCKETLDKLISELYE